MGHAFFAFEIVVVIVTFYGFTAKSCRIQSSKLCRVASSTSSIEVASHTVIGTVWANFWNRSNQIQTGETFLKAYTGSR